MSNICLPKGGEKLINRACNIGPIVFFAFIFVFIIVGIQNLLVAYVQHSDLTLVSYSVVTRVSLIVWHRAVIPLLLTIFPVTFFTHPSTPSPLATINLFFPSDSVLVSVCSLL